MRPKAPSAGIALNAKYGRALARRQTGQSDAGSVGCLGRPSGVQVVSARVVREATMVLLAKGNVGNTALL